MCYGGAGICQRERSWDSSAMVKLGYGGGGAGASFFWGAKVGIVGRHGGGICPCLPSWDSLGGTEQGLLGGRGDGIRWRS